MNGPPLRGDSNRDASRTSWPGAPEELCPDELAAMKAIRDAGEYISPSRMRRIYRRVMASMDAEAEFGTHVLTYLHRRQSIPADVTVGERAVKRLMKGGSI